MSTNQENKQVQHLASTLCLLFKIESGTELIIVIGNGDESNNHKAMENWVTTNLSKIEELSPKQQLEELKDRLMIELEYLNY